MKRQFIDPLHAHRSMRRGAVFQYYMLYLLLSGILMTSAGLCLHVILKADRVDATVAVYLKTLTRLNQIFRSDVSDSQVTDLQLKSLQLQSEDGRSIRWSIDRNILQRETLANEQRLASDRFVFAHGTDVSFSQDGRFVVCRLVEASAMPAEYKPAESQENAVEIIVAEGRQRPQKPPAAETESVEDSELAADKTGDEL